MRIGLGLGLGFHHGGGGSAPAPSYPAIVVERDKQAVWDLRTSGTGPRTPLTSATTSSNTGSALPAGCTYVNNTHWTVHVPVGVTATFNNWLFTLPVIVRGAATFNDCRFTATHIFSDLPVLSLGYDQLGGGLTDGASITTNYCAFDYDGGVANGASPSALVQLGAYLGSGAGQNSTVATTYTGSHNSYRRSVAAGVKQSGPTWTENESFFGGFGYINQDGLPVEDRVHSEAYFSEYGSRSLTNCMHDASESDAIRSLGTWTAIAMNGARNAGKVLNVHDHGNIYTGIASDGFYTITGYSNDGAGALGNFRLYDNIIEKGTANWFDFDAVSGYPLIDELYDNFDFDTGDRILQVAEKLPAAPDVTAPTLSSPTAATNGDTAMTGTVSTNEGNGTLYKFVSTSATPPSAANLKAGTGAVVSGSQAVSGTGVQNITATGLTASTIYYVHYLHRDTAGNDSAIASTSSFTTDAASSLPVTIFDLAMRSNASSGGGAPPAGTSRYAGASLTDAASGINIVAAGGPTFYDGNGGGSDHRFTGGVAINTFQEGFTITGLNAAHTYDLYLCAGYSFDAGRVFNFDVFSAAPGYGTPGDILAAADTVTNNTNRLTAGDDLVNYGSEPGDPVTFTGASSIHIAKDGFAVSGTTYLNYLRLVRTA